MVRAVLVALLVACSLAGTAIGVPPPLQAANHSPPSDPPTAAQLGGEPLGSVEMLGLDSPVRAEVTTQGVDVSVAAAAQRERAESTVDRRALEAAYEDAEDAEARRELLVEAVAGAETSASTLRSDQRALQAGYADGMITSAEYARGHAALNVRAEQLREYLDLVRELASRTPRFSAESQIGPLQATLVPLNGPVSSRVESTILGEEDGTQVYLAASENGSTMSVIEDGYYVRQTFRSDLWTPVDTRRISFDEVISRVEEIYPVFNSSNSDASGSLGTIGPDGADLAPAGLYRITIQYDDRTTTAYLDGDTRNVFYEVQDVRLVSVEPGPSVTATDNGTQLVVNRTYEGGPLRVAANDNTTGLPTDVPVFVGGTEHRTGPNGIVWVLAPQGRTQVVAVGETGNVSVAVDPVEPTLIDDDWDGG